MKRAIILSALALSACATMTKPGMTEESKAKDRYECEHEALDTRHAGGLMVNGLYRDCMRARGYK